MMFFNELDNEVRQRLIDVQQRGEALRAIRADLKRRYAGPVEWKERSGPPHGQDREGARATFG
jgi:hypothetical protein